MVFAAEPPRLQLFSMKLSSSAFAAYQLEKHINVKLLRNQHINLVIKTTPLT